MNDQEIAEYNALSKKIAIAASVQGTESNEFLNLCNQIWSSLL